MLAPGLHRVVQLGRLLVASGKRVRVPRRRKRAELLGVCLRKAVVPVLVPVEYGLRVVLLELRRVYLRSQVGIGTAD